MFWWPALAGVCKQLQPGSLPDCDGVRKPSAPGDDNVLVHGEPIERFDQRHEVCCRFVLCGRETNLSHLHRLVPDTSSKSPG